MAENFSFDAYAPAQIAQRVNDLGVAKTRIPLLSQAMLGMLAGAFIGLGALYFVIVQSDASLGFAAKRVLGGMVFSLGLLLVVVAGAELFTGNNLLAMAWADRKVSTAEVLRNWAIICASNFVGAFGLALIVFLSGHPAMNGNAVAQTYMSIALAKTTQPALNLFFSGILCNVLVCMAVWMTLAGRSVVDKLAAIALPISGFVAAGFEHSVANMYLIPMGMLLKAAAGAPMPLSGLLHNLVPVIAGNLVGGSVMVALVYYVIYLRPKKVPAPPAEEVRHAG
ncbi:MAG TPA: formate/nitrite transporter family protein [Burkholderiales bacterium]|nr:formate/nitrite transporter family protein [Burkholderiales bacterium]